MIQNKDFFLLFVFLILLNNTVILIIKAGNIVATIYGVDIYEVKTDKYSDITLKQVILDID
ncbi:MAG: hypothetical protein ACOX1L_02895 [Erysipelotrichaceae bacterium]